jgi:hypothetical protein
VLVVAIPDGKRQGEGEVREEDAVHEDAVGSGHG